MLPEKSAKQERLIWEKEKTTGTVVSAKLCWWLKINTRPVRAHALDGAAFPQIIKIRYSVNGHEYVKRKFLRPTRAPLSAGTTVKVFYQESNPKEFRIEI